MCSNESVAGQLLAAFERLAALDPSGVSVDTVHALVCAVLPLAGRLAAVGSRLVGELDHASGGQVTALDTGSPRSGSLAGPGSCPASVLVRVLTNDTLAGAARQVHAAAALRAVPRIALAAADGRLSIAQAGQLSRLVGAIDPAQLWAQQDTVVASAVGLDPVATGRLVRG